MAHYLQYSYSYCLVPHLDKEYRFKLFWWSFIEGNGIHESNIIFDCILFPISIISNIDTKTYLIFKTFLDNSPQFQDFALRSSSEFQTIIYGISHVIQNENLYPNQLGSLFNLRRWENDIRVRRTPQNISFFILGLILSLHFTGIRIGLTVQNSCFNNFVEKCLLTIYNPSHFNLLNLLSSPCSKNHVINCYKLERKNFLFLLN